jgi:putative ABC transport system permease protein
MQMQESITMAVTAIKANKLRSVLTLLGIAVGVFSIIAVMTAMGVLQGAIESGLSGLGTNTFQIQKYPAMSFHDNRSKYRNRKDITYEQGLIFVDRITGAKFVGLEAWVRTLAVTHGNDKTNPNIQIVGETPEGFPTNNWNIDRGRAFTAQEAEAEKNVCVIGTGVVDKLFPRGTPVGDDIRIAGIPFKVIGTIEKKESSLGGDQGNVVAIPITAALDLFGRNRSIHIMVQGKDQETYNDLIEQSRAVLRTIRQVPPGQDDDFEIFSNDTLIKQFNDVTFMVKIGALGIAMIAMIAAGVGIMNIMLVSVTERTKEIGIRKALGATKANVLAQFLSECVVFSQIGGIIGIVAGSLMGNVVSIVMSAPPILPWNNAITILETPFLKMTALEMNILAIIFCSFIGIVFGVYPAWKAANLDPIESLRYE